MTMSRFSPEQKLDTLLSQIDSDGIVSGAQAKELVKILKGMGPRPSAEELVKLMEATPGTMSKQISGVVAHVLKALEIHLTNDLNVNITDALVLWHKEIVKWEMEYFEAFR